MRSRAVIDHPDFDHPRPAILRRLNDATLNTVENNEIIERLGCSLESRPMEEIIPPIVPRDKAEAFLELTNLASHQREDFVLVVFEGC